MVRPCVARVFVELAVSGLASMYPPSDWSVVLLAIMDVGVARPCPIPGACASHCNGSNKRSGPVANALRQESEHGGRRSAPLITQIRNNPPALWELRSRSA